MLGQHFGFSDFRLALLLRWWRKAKRLMAMLRQPKMLQKMIRSLQPCWVTEMLLRRQDLVGRAKSGLRSLSYQRRWIMLLLCPGQEWQSATTLEPCCSFKCTFSDSLEAILRHGKTPGWEAYPSLLRAWSAVLGSFIMKPYSSKASAECCSISKSFWLGLWLRHQLHSSFPDGLWADLCLKDRLVPE